MKFLHLADLHIGKTLGSFSMLEEQKHILNQILGYVYENKPNAVIISGDVYDKSTPSVEAVKVFDEFLTSLAEEKITALVIAGNHDSPERLNFASRIIEKQNIYLCSIFDGQIRHVDIEDDYGNVRFFLLPFLKPLNVRRFFTGEEINDYNDALKAVIKISEINYEKRNVLIAHQFVVSSGNEAVLSDSEINQVGGLDFVDVNIIKDFDYVALGHLHAPQFVKNANIRYAGSPLKYSASECLHKKSLPLVELSEKGSINITELELKPLHDVRRIKGPLDELLKTGELLGDEKNDYLFITLTDDEVLDAIGKIRAVYPNVVSLCFDNTRTRGYFPENIIQTDNSAPQELFKEFFKQQNGMEPKLEQQVIAEKLLSQVLEESNRHESMVY